MACRKVWALALGFSVILTVLGGSATVAQTTIQNGKKVSANAPKLVLLHGPERIIPGRSLPVYVSVKAGESPLKEIVWSFESPPSGEVAFGRYRIKKSEEREVTGQFRVSTFDAIRRGTLSNFHHLYVYITIWGRDEDDRISKMGEFTLTMDLQGPETFPPPNSNIDFSKRLGTIEGRIIPPESGGSHISN